MYFYYIYFFWTFLHGVVQSSTSDLRPPLRHVNEYQSFQPFEILNLTSPSANVAVPFEGIPLSLRPNLKYIEISWRILISGSQLVDALEGCINLQELRLDSLTTTETAAQSHPNTNETSNQLDFGPRKVYLPALKVYTLSGLKNKQLGQPNHLAPLLPFHKALPKWELGQLHTLGLNIQISSVSRTLFEFNYGHQRIYAYNIPSLGVILVGCCHYSGKFVLRSLTISTSGGESSAPSVALPRPDSIPTTLHKLTLSTNQDLQETDVKSILVRTTELRTLHLRSLNNWNKISLDVAQLPKDTLEDLVLLNVHLGQSAPTQLQFIKNFTCTNCKYNDSFVTGLGSTFLEVSQVVIRNEVQEPARDQRLLTKIFATKARHVQYGPFDRSLVVEFLNSSDSAYGFNKELKRVGGVITIGKDDGKPMLVFNRPFQTSAAGVPTTKSNYFISLLFSGAIIIMIRIMSTSLLYSVAY